jgi:hypothetical protein
VFKEKLGEGYTQSLHVIWKYLKMKTLIFKNLSLRINIKNVDQVQCLTSVIPSTQKTEIRGSQVEARQGKKNSKILLQRTSQVWWYTPINPNYMGSISRRIMVQGWSREKVLDYI